MYNFRMEENQPIPFRFYLPAMLVLIVVGAVGIALILTMTLPTIGPRWLFFFFIVIFVTGLFLPLTWFINLRFPSKPPVPPQVIVRQAAWFGIFAALLLWLRMGRVLTAPLGVILAAALFLVEFLIRLWERSRWNPQQ
ncbi:MAG: hypothetical protein KBA05_04835 [Anaerolineaceae bacterium]|jgi:hypothetical protein|nr:hypothetical protein [Anaerolineaceae bacterium]MDI9531071.1 hypothetical protein [Chloroflexota bacterium]HNZ16345.1 hypothetical protein [Anaerolineaceae bacterium]